MLRDIEQFINLAISPFEGETIVSSEAEGSERLQLIRNAVIKLKSVDAYLEAPEQYSSVVQEEALVTEKTNVEAEIRPPDTTLDNTDMDNQADMAESARHLLSDSGIYPHITEVKNDQFALGA